jgi:hypothetical protein
MGVAAVAFVQAKASDCAYHRRMRFTVMLLIALLPALPAAADIIATYDDKAAREGQVTVSVKNSRLARLDMGQGAYVLLKDDEAFIVHPRADSGFDVMRMTDIAKVIDVLLGADLRAVFGPAKLTPRPGVKARKIGSQIVAGVPGEVYAFTGLGNQAEAKVFEIVFSKDPKLRPIADAYRRFADYSALMMGALFGPQATREMLADNHFVFSHGAPLATPGRMTLKSLRDAPVDPAHYSVPAAPMTVEQIEEAMKKAAR